MVLQSVLCPKDTEEIANSVDPVQTAPQESKDGWMGMGQVAWG